MLIILRVIIWGAKVIHFFGIHPFFSGFQAGKAEIFDMCHYDDSKSYIGWLNRVKLSA